MKRVLLTIGILAAACITASATQIIYVIPTQSRDAVYGHHNPGEEPLYLRYKPEKHSLNEFIGYDKAFLDKLFGEPEKCTDVGDYISVFYSTVMWRGEKKRMYMGITVMYDADGIARYK